MLSTVYIPMKPMRVNRALPADTEGEFPSMVRIRPCTSQGCRPSSAVSQPAVLAM